MSVQTLHGYRTRLAGLPDSAFIGSVLWYSIAGTVERGIDGKRQVFPVRCSQDLMEEWFDELGLDKQFLPSRIKKIDAFRNASSAVKREYILDEGNQRFAELRVEEVRSDAEQVIRHVVQIVRDERKEQLALHHMATLKFIRGGRTAKGKRHSGDHVKTAVLTRVKGEDREQVQALLDDFDERFEDLAVNLQSPAIRGVIRTILGALGAIAMKTSGGVYFVPKTNWPQVDALQQLIRRIGQGCVLEQFPLVDTTESRDMLTEAYQAEVEDDVRLLLRKIAELNTSKKNGKITAKQYADLNALYHEVAGRAQTTGEQLGLAMGRAAGALELALESVTEMATRIEFTGHR